MLLLALLPSGWLLAIPAQYSRLMKAYTLLKNSYCQVAAFAVRPGREMSHSAGIVRCSFERWHCAGVRSDPTQAVPRPHQQCASDPANHRLPASGLAVPRRVHGGASCLQVPCSFQEIDSQHQQLEHTSHINNDFGTGGNLNRRHKRA